MKMSDFDRKKIISNKHRNFPRDGSASGRTFSGRNAAATSKEKDSGASDVKHPTILLKSRETTGEENPTNAKRKTKEGESMTSSFKENEATAPVLKHMTKSIKLIEDGLVNTDHLQDYLQENSDFIVVGVVGSQGVGKSTILNLLSEKKITAAFKKSLFRSHADQVEDCDSSVTILTKKLEGTHIDDKHIFKVEQPEDIENCINTTKGIDIYVSPNRVIFLDCQPFLSVAVLDELIESENKRTNLVSEFIPLENSGEIQGLQYTAFLMSVCHILLLVQDWFFDSNVVRFIQTAEMLKPTISNPEDEYSEHFPHLIMIQNRAQMADFTPKQFKIMQKNSLYCEVHKNKMPKQLNSRCKELIASLLEYFERERDNNGPSCPLSAVREVYATLFQKTKLQFHSNLGLGSGRIMNTLDPENCGSQVNLFLVPEQGGASSESDIYSGHPPLEDLIKKLRANLFGATKNPLTHVQLTEKTWLVYCNKVWETVKKSPFFVEYTKLMP